MSKLMKNVATKPAASKPAEVKKTSSKNYLEKVPETMVFWCNDGQIFDCLDQLLLGFDMMTEETFMYHCNQEKNDFSCWIMDVVGDGELAKDIKKAKTKTEAKKITQQRHHELYELWG